MVDQLVGLLWFTAFVGVAGMLGLALLLVGAWLVPRMVDRMTPAIDETREIARGNQAVASYFGRIVSAALVALGIIIGAAVIGGCLLFRG